MLDDASLGGPKRQRGPIQGGKRGRGRFSLPRLRFLLSKSVPDSDSFCPVYRQSRRLPGGAFTVTVAADADSAEIHITAPTESGGVTRVCIVGDPETDLRFELLSRETAREALATYDLDEPFENALGLSTVSVGAAVSLLNDLNWYLVRFADTAWVREPSISDEEWLSRELAAAVRNNQITPAETGEFLKIYGVERDSPADVGELVEPLYARRRDGSVPEYDLRDVEETAVVRVTEAEFE